MLDRLWGLPWCSFTIKRRRSPRGRRRKKIEFRPVRLEPLECRRLLALETGILNVRDLFPEGIVPPPDQWPYATENANAADTTNADQVRSGGGLGLSLNGSGVTVGIWDGGPVRSTHQELTGRVTVVDSGTNDDHATHVAGTIGATGVNTSARGMASSVSIRSRDFNSDTSEISSDASLIHLSNHSYGSRLGWEGVLGWGGTVGNADTWFGDRSLFSTEDAGFGKYNTSARSLDTTLFNNPNLLSVWSAGNDRGDAFTNAKGNGTYVAWFSTAPSDPGRVPTGGTIDGQTGWYLVSSSVISLPAADGGATGHDTISGGTKTAKNNVVVGAINDITADPYTSGSISITSFSGFGPVDDGRIKPDVVGNGASLSSSTAASNTAYSIFSGTSMASPNVTGTAALLLQHYRNVFGTNPRSATLKGELIHTAADGGNVGPDYAYGWGVVDAAAAAMHISNSTLDGAWSSIEENTYSGTQQTRVVYSDGARPLKATVVWTDPAPASIPGSGLDDATANLVNDLDLWITNSGGTTFFPWTLNPASPTAAAVRTVRNSRDNVEQVLIDAPAAGWYTIRIGHTGGSFTQAYSLLVSGGNAIGDSFEPNDNFGAAAILGTLGDRTETNLSIHTANNEDFYRVTAAASGNLTASLAFINAQGNLDLYVYDAAQTQIGSSTTTNNGESVTVPIASGQTYYIRVVGVGGATNLDYDLVLDGPNTTFSNASTISIPSSGAASPYPSNITVSGLSGVVEKVTVTLTAFTHTWPDDVDILLVGPAGQKIVLLSDAGGNNAVSNLTLRFDDDAPSTAPDETVLVADTYKPTDFVTGDTFPAPAPGGAPTGTTLSVFNGTNPNGTWSLYIVDDASGDFGMIGGWSLAFTASTAGTTTVALDGSNNLVITDTVGGATNDSLKIFRYGAYLRIRDANNALSAGTGTVQVNANTVQLLMSSVMGNLQVNSLDGSDLVTIDFASGNPIPPGGIVYAGGSGATDSLAIIGGATTSVTHTFANANDGNVLLAGALGGTITYTGLEPITDTLSAADRVFTFNGGGETIVITDHVTAGMNSIDSTLGEIVHFANPSASMTLNAGSGGDTITIASIDSAYNAALTINGGVGDDVVNLNADMTLAANRNLEVDLLDDDASPGADSIQLGADANLSLSGTGIAALKASQQIVYNTASSIATASGAIAIEAGSFTTSGAATTSSGTISVAADSMALNAGSTINGGGNFVTLRPRTPGTAINLGAADSAGVLGLTDAELDRVTAGTLVVGDSNSGSITVSAAITAPAGWTRLSLRTGGAIVDGNASGTDLTVANLALRAVTGIGSADTLETAVTNLAAANTGTGAAGNIAVNNSTALTITGTAIDGLTGVANTSGGSVSLTSGSPLTVSAAINAGSGNIELITNSIDLAVVNAVQSTGALTIKPLSLNGTIGLGTGSGTLSLTQAEIGRLVDGFSSITLGDAAAGTGKVTAEGATFVDRVLIRGGEFVVTGSSGGLNAGVNDITIVARTGSISSADGTATTDITGGVVTLQTLTGSGDKIGTSASSNYLMVSAGTLVTDSAGGNQHIQITGNPVSGGATTWNTSTAGSGDIFLWGGQLNVGAGQTINAGTVTANGSGVLGGVGTLNAPLRTSVSGTGGTVAPGNSPGVLNTGNASFGATSAFNVEIGGPSPGNGSAFHDQLNVAGSVTIVTGASLNISSSGGFVPSAGQTFVLINNQSADPISGNYSGYPQGQTIPNFLGSGLTATVSYTGGTGNDMVISLPAAATVTLSLSGSPMAENGGTATVTATLNAAIASPVTVDLAFSGTATLTSDYTRSATSIVIPAGSTSASITLAAVQDTLDEADETIVVDISNVTNATESGMQQVTAVIADDDTALQVEQFAATATGFVANFTRNLDANVLNLYDVQAGTFGPADVTVQGNSTGTIRGSLVVDPSLRKITFVRTGGLLAPDTYTVTLRSASNGFKDTGGLLLDGNSDGNAGDNFQQMFTVSAPPANAVTVGIPEFSRGPGQPVNVPAAATGIPLTLSDGTNVTSVTLQLAYSTSLLTLTGATVGAGMPPGSTVNLNTSMPGVAVVTFTSPTALSPGAQNFVNLQANVPVTATYTTKQVLDLMQISINTGAIPALDNDGLHVAAFFGDTSGNGSYSGLDAARLARNVVGLDAGLAAYLLLDNAIVADITGDGMLSGLDTSRVSQVVVAMPVAEIPTPLPPGTVTQGGPDPRLFVPDLSAEPGQPLLVPVNLETPSHENIPSPGLEAIDIVLRFDPAVFTYDAAHPVLLASLLTGWAPPTVNAATPGQLIITTSSVTGLVGNPTGTLFNIPLVVSAAANGSFVLNLAAAAAGSTVTALNEGGLTLTPRPTDAADDPVDGTVTIAAAESLPALFIGDVSASEGNSGTTSFVFPVLLSKPSTEGVIVAYSTFDWTALANGGVYSPDRDYQVKIGSLSFAPGTTLAQIVVAVTADATAEADETFFIGLNSPVNATIADGLGIGTILNDDTPRYVAVGPDAGLNLPVRIVDLTDPRPESYKFQAFPFGNSFTQGVRVAIGDINGDGTPDLITAPGPGTEPRIKIYNGAALPVFEPSDLGRYEGNDSHLLATYLAFPPAMTAGVWIATADFDGDGDFDLAVGPDAGGGRTLRMLDGMSGAAIARDITAFDASFTGGVRVAAGDIDGDGLPDLLASAGRNNLPRVQVFKTGGSLIAGPLADFMAYATAFTGGVFMAAGDLNGDRRADIVTGPDLDGGAHVRWFDGATGAVVNQFFVYAPAFTGGIRVGTMDFDGDGQADIVTGAGLNGGPHMRSFAGNAAQPVLNAPSQAEKFGYADAFFGGVFVAGIPVARPATSSRISASEAPADDLLRLAALSQLQTGELSPAISVRLAAIAPQKDEGDSGPADGSLFDWLEPASPDPARFDSEWLDDATTQAVAPPATARRAAGAAGGEPSDLLHTLVHQLGCVWDEEQLLA